MHRVFRATKIKIGTSIGIDLGATHKNGKVEIIADGIVPFYMHGVLWRQAPRRRGSKQPGHRKPSKHNLWHEATRRVI